LDIANAILQLNTESIRLTISRFLINVTFGLGGMYDVAGTPAFGSIEKREEDFGQTLASWGMPEGPFVVLPIFGPSNVRSQRSTDVVD
jgi:phospholipid-binding lipoprotein MlaA